MRITCGFCTYGIIIKYKRFSAIDSRYQSMSANASAIRLAFNFNGENNSLERLEWFIFRFGSSYSDFDQRSKDAIGCDLGHANSNQNRPLEHFFLIFMQNKIESLKWTHTKDRNERLTLISMNVPKAENSVAVIICMAAPVPVPSFKLSTNLPYIREWKW